MYWVLGGRINGGRIAGEQVRVERRTLFQDRDYPVLNNYRNVLAACSGPCGGSRRTNLIQYFRARRRLI